MIKRRLPGPLQKDVDCVLEKSDPREVEKIITNIERALDKMQRVAEARGMEKGIKEGQTKAKVEGKIEVARAALKKGFSVDDVVEITGLTRETVLELKQELDN